MTTRFVTLRHSPVAFSECLIVSRNLSGPTWVTQIYPRFMSYTPRVAPQTNPFQSSRLLVFNSTVRCLLNPHSLHWQSHLGWRRCFRGPSLRGQPPPSPSCNYHMLQSGCQSSTPFPDTPLSTHIFVHRRTSFRTTCSSSSSSAQILFAKSLLDFFLIRHV